MLTSVRGLKVPTWNAGDRCFSLSVPAVNEQWTSSYWHFQTIRVTKRRNSAFVSVISRRVDVKTSLSRFFLFPPFSLLFFVRFQTDRSFLSFLSFPFLLILRLSSYAFLLSFKLNPFLLTNSTPPTISLPLSLYRKIFRRFLSFLTISYYWNCQDIRLETSKRRSFYRTCSSIQMKMKE